MESFTPVDTFVVDNYEVVTGAWQGEPAPRVSADFVRAHPVLLVNGDVRTVEGINSPLLAASAPIYAGSEIAIRLRVEVLARSGFHDAELRSQAGKTLATGQPQVVRHFNEFAGPSQDGSEGVRVMFPNLDSPQGFSCLEMFRDDFTPENLDRSVEKLSKAFALMWREAKGQAARELLQSFGQERASIDLAAGLAAESEEAT